jgi:hypothetical protein
MSDLALYDVVLAGGLLLKYAVYSVLALVRPSPHAIQPPLVDNAPRTWRLCCILICRCRYVVAVQVHDQFAHQTTGSRVNMSCTCVSASAVQPQVASRPACLNEPCHPHQLQITLSTWSIVGCHVHATYQVVTAIVMDTGFRTADPHPHSPPYSCPPGHSKPGNRRRRLHDELATMHSHARQPYTRAAVHYRHIVCLFLVLWLAYCGARMQVLFLCQEAYKASFAFLYHTTYMVPVPSPHRSNISSTH